MVFTRMLRSFRSRIQLRAKARTAALEAAYTLNAGVPELAATAARHYDAWEQAIIDFVADRSGQPSDALYPLLVGRTTLAACRAAYERWAARGDTDLRVYLDEALRTLAAGFAVTS